MASTTSDSRLFALPYASTASLINTASPTSLSLPLPHPPYQHQITSCICTAIQPNTTATSLVLAYLSPSTPDSPAHTLLAHHDTLSPSPHPPIPLPPLSPTSPVLQFSTTGTLQFSTHDPTLLLYTESFTLDSATPRQHRIHLLKLTQPSDIEPGVFELVGTTNINEYQAAAKIGDAMSEAASLLRPDADVETIEDVLETLTTPRRAPHNPNDISLTSNSFAAAWLPATRSIITVQFGDVWYWSTSTSHASAGFTLTSQDTANLALKGSPVTTVVSSLTTTILPPTSRLGKAKPPLAPADDVVILVQGHASRHCTPTIHRIDTTTPSLVSTLTAPLPDTIARTTTVTAAVISPPYLLLGLSSGVIITFDTATLAPLPAFTIEKPTVGEERELRRTAMKKDKARSAKGKTKKSTQQITQRTAIDASPASTPVTNLLITGPATGTPLVLAQYADGLTIVHSPFAPTAPSTATLPPPPVPYISILPPAHSTLTCIAFPPHLILPYSPCAHPLMITSGTHPSIALTPLPPTSSPNPPTNLPPPPHLTINLPKSLHTTLSSSSIPANLATSPADHSLDPPVNYLHGTPASPALTVTALAVNNNGTELAAVTLNKTLFVYDLTASGGGKVAFKCELGGVGGCEGVVRCLSFSARGGTRDSQFLAWQDNEGVCGVAERRCCFGGGPVVCEGWGEGVGSLGLESFGSPVAWCGMIGDGVDEWVLFNESLVGKKHCVTRRAVGRVRGGAVFVKGRKEMWRRDEEDSGVDDFDRVTQSGGAVPVLNGLEATIRFKSDAIVVGAGIHSSEQFVVMLSGKGTVFIYHVWLGELRGVFPSAVNLDLDSVFVRGISMDPEGLYVAVGTGVKRPAFGGSDGFVSGLEVFELTTGCEAIKKEGVKEECFGGLIQSSAFEWSRSGNHIAFVGARGGVDVRAVPGFMVGNMEGMRKKIKVDPRFWEAFPMYVNVSPSEAQSVHRGGGGGSPMRGSVSRAGTPNMSRVQSRAGFTDVSEMSRSELGEGDGGYGIERNMEPASGLMGEMMNKDASKSTLFGRHSSASSPTA